MKLHKEEWACLLTFGLLVVLVLVEVYVRIRATLFFLNH